MTKKPFVTKEQLEKIVKSTRLRFIYMDEKGIR